MWLVHPPKSVVCLRNMQIGGLPNGALQKATSELIENTLASLDNDTLKVLLVLVQHSNVELCMKSAAESGGIISTAQEAFRTNSGQFQPQREFIENIFMWFPYIWHGDLETDNYQHIKPKCFTLLLHGTTHHWSHTQEAQDPAVIQAALHGAADTFLDALNPQLSTFAEDLSYPQQVLNIGAAAVIIAASAFWLNPDTAETQGIHDSFNLYCELGIVGQVKMEILGKFQDTRAINSPYSKARFADIVMNNQISSEGVHPFRVLANTQPSAAGVMG